LLNKDGSLPIAKPRVLSMSPRAIKAREKRLKLKNTKMESKK